MRKLQVQILSKLNGFQITAIVSSWSMSFSEEQNIDRSTDCCEHAEIRFIHVGGVLPPGTCVPDPKRTMKYPSSGKDNAVKQVYVLCFSCFFTSYNLLIEFADIF
jgi:hypothetical protein